MDVQTGESPGSSGGGTGHNSLEKLVQVNPAVKLLNFYEEKEAKKQGNEWETKKAEGEVKV
jgi:hypothetical protein